MQARAEYGFRAQIPGPAFCNCIHGLLDGAYAVGIGLGELVADREGSQLRGQSERTGNSATAWQTGGCEARVGGRNKIGSSIKIGESYRCRLHLSGDAALPCPSKCMRNVPRQIQCVVAPRVFRFPCPVVRQMNDEKAAVQIAAARLSKAVGDCQFLPQSI